MNIAIVGLGRVGTQFINKILDFKDKGIHIVAAAEEMETEGKKTALNQGILMKTSNEIAAMGDKIDIIFDLTGNAEVRKTLREALHHNQNHHTAVAPENFVYLLWSVMEDKPLPDVHTNKGY